MSTRLANLRYIQFMCLPHHRSISVVLLYFVFFGIYSYLADFFHINTSPKRMSIKDNGEKRKKVIPIELKCEIIDKNE